MKSLFRLLWLAMVPILASNAPAQALAPKLLPFQARLTDQTGTAVPNGSRVVQFKIYAVPSGGSPVWAGELHKTTVNGGLVNVLLGSKTPFTGVDFDQTLYLEVTADLNADDAISAADAPMLPRQVILPAVFAKESAESRKLAGHDWTPIFGTNSPAGPLPATKLAPGSITSAQIAPGGIESASIRPNAITSAQIAAGTITSNHVAPNQVHSGLLAPGAVDTLALGEATVTLSKLASRGTPTNAAPLGGVAMSGSCYKTTTSNSPTDVPELTVTLATSGRPVMVALVADGIPANVSFLGAYRTGDAHVYAVFHVRRDSTEIAAYQVGGGTHGNNAVCVPSSSLSVIDFPNSGTHTYTVQLRAGAGGPEAIISNCRLVAFEF